VGTVGGVVVVGAPRLITSSSTTIGGFGAGITGGTAPGRLGTVGTVGGVVVVGAPKLITSSSTTMGGFGAGIAGGTAPGRLGTVGAAAGVDDVVGAPKSKDPSSTVTAGFGTGIAGGTAPGRLGTVGAAAGVLAGCWMPPSSMLRLIDAVISTTTTGVGLVSGIGGGLPVRSAVSLTATSSRRPSGPVSSR